MSAWMPIETAPKDGTPFLAFDINEEQHVLCWREGKPYGDRGPGRGSWAWRLHRWMFGEQELFRPTHWQPLPQPPEET